MWSLKNKYILYLVALNGVLATLLIGWGKNIFEDVRSFSGIAGALAMLFFYELLAIWIADANKGVRNSNQSINLFLGLKVGRILLSIFFIAVFAVFVKVETIRFIGVFLVLYLVYLLFDTMYLVGREKELKKLKTENRE